MTQQTWSQMDDGGASGAVLTAFVIVILLVAFVVVATRLGFDMNTIITAFKKFFGLVITLGGR